MKVILEVASFVIKKINKLKKNILKTIGYVIILVLFAYPFYYYINHQKTTENLKKIIKTPFYSDINNSLIISGVISPEREVEIKSRISGLLENLYISPGDTVEEGQMIAKIKVVANINDLNFAQSRVKQSKLELELIQQDYNRNVILFQKGVIARKEFEIIKNQFLIAKEQLKNSREKLNFISNGNKNSKNTNTNIKSTISGVVTSIPIEKGMTIIESNNFNDGTTISKIADLSNMIFFGEVREHEILDLKLGMEVKLTLGLNTEIEHKGIITYIDTNGIESNGSITYKIKIKVLDYFLQQTGFSANAEILISNKTNVLVVKEKWLIFKNDSIYIESLLNDGSSKLTPIVTGISDGINMEVISGINKNTRLIVQ